MNVAPPALNSAATLAPFIEENREPVITGLFTAYEQKVYVQTNRLFWWLLMSQWAFSLLIALVWSPRTWTGTESSVHPHVTAAVALGGLLVSLPLALMHWLPHHALTRHSVAVAQVGFSALLIHLTGGRIETHFHVFGSLAFLAVYRDWRVLITATLVVAIDHLLRGLWYPESVYGVPYATIWRTVEHAGWVIFEDVVLIWACFVSRREMWEICRRQDAHQQLHDGLEQRVRERTRALEAEVSARARTTQELSRSEDRYRTLIGNLPLGVFETTKDGRVLLANPYLLSLLGLPADQDLTNLNMADGKIIQPEERQRFWAALRAQIQVHGFETTLRTVSGESVHVRIHARRNLNREGTLSCEGTLENVTARKLAELELEEVHQRLVTASRQAGMADVATGVLHNVGNVLTSVNVTVHDVLDRLRSSPLTHLHRLVELIQNERPRLASFLTDDPKGRQIPDFLVKLDTRLSEENERLRADVESLVQHFEHIRQIIVTQQSSARLCGLTENLTSTQLFEDALKLSADSLERHGILLERNLGAGALVRADRHKVLQILVNLIKNAKDALLSHAAPSPRLRVRVESGGEGRVALIVEDNGPGISPEHLARIFQHGFTTKPNGHGFGLHSAVLAAREMGGDLTLSKAPEGNGAVFTLLLPQST